MEEIKRFFMANDKFAAHAGIELVEAGAGYAKVRMPVRDYHLNGVKTVHGGAIFTLADFAFAVASNSHGRIAVGINASIDYMRAVSAGVLVAEAREVFLNHRLGNYVVEVVDERNEPVAAFRGTVYRKRDALNGAAEGESAATRS